MNSFRVALLVVVVLVVVGVVVAVVRPLMPPSLSGSASAALLPLDERPAAPDFTGIDSWINTRPLHVASLRGHVVLVDFWTFSCVNCVRTIPHLQQLDAAYAHRGLVIVGVHAPEFDFEKVRANVVAAVRRLGITWPVALNSQMATWRAYDNEYWPEEYLLDQQGRIAYVHVGEGDYQATAQAVAALLDVKPRMRCGAPTAVPADITPELYAGSEPRPAGRRESYGPQGEPVAYADTGAATAAGCHPGDRYLDGPGPVPRRRFRRPRPAATSTRTPCTWSPGTTGAGLPVTVSLDGHAGRRLPWRARRCTAPGSTSPGRTCTSCWRTSQPGHHLVDLAVPAGFQLYTFTFG